MFVSTSFVVALTAGLTGVLGQNATGNSSNCIQSPTFPDSAIAWGSAGGLWPITETGSQSGNASAYYSWLYSVHENGDTNVTLAIPPGSPVPADNSFWSICQMSLELPVNVIERAQTDNGSCRQALDSPCVEEILNAARLNTVGSNPSAACTRASTYVFEAIKNGSCTKFFGNGTGFNLISIALNDRRGANESMPCRQVSRNIRPGYTFIPGATSSNRPLKGLFPDTGDKAAYYEAFRTVKGIVSIYIRNDGPDSPRGRDSGQFVDMNCPRVTDFSTNLGAAPKLPDPSPINAAGLISPAGSVMGGPVIVALVTSFLLVVSALW